MNVQTSQVRYTLVEKTCSPETWNDNISVDTLKDSGSAESPEPPPVACTSLCRMAQATDTSSGAVPPPLLAAKLIVVVK